MKEYLLSIVSAAVVCAVLVEIVGSKTPSGASLKLLSGIFIAVVIMKPLLQLDLEPYLYDADRLMLQAESVAAMGEHEAEQKKKVIITESLQEYITQKAEQMGVHVEPEIELDGLVPSGVQIKGNASPYIRASLSAWIEDTLGIPKEDQMWIG